MGRYEYRKNTSDTTLNGNSDMIDLGKAGQFVILAKTNINNESESMISGHTGEGSVADKTKKEQDFTRFYKAENYRSGYSLAIGPK
jgi:hypothetical protein